MKGLYLRRKKWWISFTHEGKRYRLSTGCDYEPEAIEIALRILENPADWIGEETRIDILLAEYLKEKRIKGISESRLDTVRFCLARFLRDHGVKRPSELTGDKITAWVDAHWERNEGTAVVYRTAMAGFTRWLKARDEIRRDPCLEIPKRKIKKRVRKRFLTRDECRALLHASEGDLKIAIYLALHCGLRKGEVLQVAPHWLDLDAGLIHVQSSADWQPKDRENRTIPLTRELAAFLAPYATRSPFIIKPNANASRYRWDFKEPFNKLTKKAGIDCTFHDLRRTFASQLVSAGVSIYKVAKWLGDGVAVVEEYYGHLIPADDEINKAWE